MTVAISNITKRPLKVAKGGVEAPSIEYIRMEEDWELPVYLWNGTKAMRKAETKYLPQEEGESDAAYKARLNRTFLYNAFKNSVQRLAGQAFLKDVLVENVPPELEYLEHSFDAEGRSITEVAYDLMVDQLRFGKAHGVMDYPETTHVVTLADEKRLKIRPYFTKVDPRDLIAWKAERLGGTDVLLEIRIQEIITEPYGEFDEIEVYRVRVFRPNEVSVWREEDKAMREGDTQPFTLGEIPLVTAYGEKTGYLTAKSPLDDLAWLNLRHWQSSSDQNNILHVARVPIFFAKGFEEGELSQVTFGAHRGIQTNSPDADIKYIEHSGKAIDSGRTDLLDLERRMHEMGADLMVSKSVSRQTKGGRELDRSESVSVLQTIIDSLERALENAYELAGKWLGVDASDVRVTIAEEFSLPNGDDPNPIDSLQKLNISDEDLTKELKRRGIIGEGVKVSAGDRTENNDLVTQEE